MPTSKLQQWLSKRFQFDQSKQLKQRDILVFIYQQGYLYLILILITFIAGINYANNLILGFCFLISAILCMSFYLTFKQLHELKIELVLPEIGQVGEVLQVHLVVSQRQSSTHYLYVRVDDQSYPLLLDGIENKLSFDFVPEQRGQFELPRIQIYSTYPFGLVRAWTYLYINTVIWIAPAAVHYQNEFQSAVDSGLPDMDEYRELRNFQLGDALQLISWKQVARGQGLYVKQFENQSELNVIHIDYGKMPSPNHEEKLSLMMGLVDLCEQQQAQYRLSVQHVELEQGLGRQQKLNAQLILAQV